MIPEESVAYALASWSRFDESVPDGLLRAVSGAFVLVAASDGVLDRAETERFVDVLRGKADAFRAVDFGLLEGAFRDLCEAMVADPEDGRRLALDCVARVKGVPRHAELVASAARIAAEADGRLRSVEESAMREIRAALDLEA